MSSKGVTSADQIRFIRECRASGLSDSAWCREHDINPGTFYNWVSRHKKLGDFIPESSTAVPVQQEVVLLDIKPQSEEHRFPGRIPGPETYQPTMQLKIGSIELSITNETNPSLLAQTLRILQSMTC